MIRRISPLCIGLAVSFASMSAFAQDEGTPETVPATDAPADGTAGGAVSTDDAGGKIHLGVRLGYGIPLGKASDTDNGDLNKLYSGKIPIWLDLGYFVTPNVMIGLYGQYAIAMIADDFCTEGADCSGSVIRIGLQGQYHLSPGESMNPWFGLGIGYEIANFSAEADTPLGSIEIDGSAKGLEFANIQAGADFKVADNVGIGPFVSFSLGQYSSFESGDSGGDVEEKAMHEWLVIGVKGSFGF
jgi:outer membrane protein W